MIGLTVVGKPVAHRDHLVARAAAGARRACVEVRHESATRLADEPELTSSAWRRPISLREALLELRRPGPGRQPEFERRIDQVDDLALVEHAPGKVDLRLARLELFRRERRRRGTRGPDRGSGRVARRHGRDQGSILVSSGTRSGTGRACGRASSTRQCLRTLAGACEPTATGRGRPPASFEAAVDPVNRPARRSPRARSRRPALRHARARRRRAAPLPAAAAG